MAAIEGLSPAYRQTVALRLQGDLNYEQIAGELNVSVGTVKSRLHYAVRALRAARDAAERIDGGER